MTRRVCIVTLLWLLTAANVLTLVQTAQGLSERFPAQYAVPGLSKSEAYAPVHAHTSHAVGTMNTRHVSRFKFRSLPSVYDGIIRRSKLVQDADLSLLIAKAAAACTYGMMIVTALGTLGIGTSDEVLLLHCSDILSLHASCIRYETPNFRIWHYWFHNRLWAQGNHVRLHRHSAFTLFVY